MSSEAKRESGTAARLGGLLRDSTLYFAGNIAFKVIGFVMIPFYAHYLSPAQSGVLNLVELALQIVAIAFGVQSVGPALTRIYSEQTSPEARAATVSTTLAGAVGLAGGAALIACVFAVPIAAAISLPGQAGLLRLAFAAMFFSSLVEIGLVFERMRNRPRFYLAYTLSALSVTLGLNIFLIGFVGLGVSGFLISKIVVACVGALYLLWRIFSEVGLAVRPALLRALTRFGAPLIVSGASYFAIHFSDRLFLAHISKADVGVYALAYNFAFLLSVIIGDSFTKSWNVSLYSYTSGEGWQARVATIARWLIFVLGTGAVGISLFGRDMLTLMVPPPYYPPVGLLPVLVFGYFLREVGDLFNSLLLVGIGSGLVGRIAVVGAVLNLGLNALLIPRYGIWGAAWATFLTWALYFGISWVMAARVHRLRLSVWPIVTMLGLAGLALGVRHVAHPQATMARLADDVAAQIGFLVAAFALFLTAAERRTVWDAARRFLPR